MTNRKKRRARRQYIQAATTKTSDTDTHTGALQSLTEEDLYRWFSWALTPNGVTLGQDDHPAPETKNGRLYNNETRTVLSLIFQQMLRWNGKQGRDERALLGRMMMTTILLMQCLAVLGDLVDKYREPEGPGDFEADEWIWVCDEEGYDKEQTLTMLALVGFIVGAVVDKQSIKLSDMADGFSSAFEALAKIMENEGAKP